MPSVRGESCREDAFDLELEDKWELEKKVGGVGRERRQNIPSRGKSMTHGMRRESD